MRISLGNPLIFHGLVSKFWTSYLGDRSPIQEASSPWFAHAILGQVQETFLRRKERFLKAKNENLLFVRVVNGTQDFFFKRGVWMGMGDVRGWGLEAFGCFLGIISKHCYLESTNDWPDAYLKLHRQESKKTFRSLCLSRLLTNTVYVPHLSTSLEP